MGVPERFLSVAAKLRELGADNVEIAYVWERTREGDAYLDDERIHEALKEINPELAEKFFREMRIKVWRTDLRQEHFNRRRIVESLLRETHIPRSLAERIARDVEQKIRETDITIITSPLIRELVLARLIEMGQTDAYSRYMRLGIPVFDLEKAMERGNADEEILRRIFTQYVIFEVLPQPAAELLMCGCWEIAGIGRPYVPYAKAFVMRTPSKTAWLRELMNYLMRRDYISKPSVMIPEHLKNDKTVSELVTALKSEVIFWEGDRNEAKYEFGSGPRIVADLITVHADQLAGKAATLAHMSMNAERIAKGIQRYKEFKRRFVKRGELIVRIAGIDRAAERLVVKREDVEEALSPLNQFEPRFS